jgi:1-acyl-sn-glycerol-3-phosphate acyltransferase
MNARGILRFLRILSTWGAFSIFMVGGMVMVVTVFPVVRLWPGSPSAKGRRVRRMIQLAFTTFLGYLRVVGIMRKPDVKGLEHVNGAGSCLIIASHPTLMDVVLLVSLIRDCNCVVKRSLWKHFFLGGVVRAAEYIPNDDGPQLITECEESSKMGRPLLIFPEGTRSPANGLHRFNRGAAQIALRASVPVVPAVLTCFPPTLMKHQPLHDVPPQPFRLTLQFHPPAALPPEVLRSTELPLQVRILTRHWEELFSAEMSSRKATQAPASGTQIASPSV